MAVLTPRDAVARTATVPAIHEPARPAWEFKLCLAAADLTAIAVALTGAYLLRVALFEAPPVGGWRLHARLALAATPVWVGALVSCRLYAARFISTRVEELRRIVHATGATVLGTAVLAFFLRWYVSRGWLALSFVVGVPALALEREAARAVFLRLRQQRRLTRPTLIVGANLEAVGIADMLLEHAGHGYDIVGFVDDELPVGVAVHGDRAVAGSTAETLDVIAATGANCAIIVPSALDAWRINALARELLEAGIHVELSSTLADIAARRLTVRSLGRFPMLYIEPARRSGWRGMAKRASDVVVAAVATIALAPVFVVIAIAVRLDSPGSVLFAQERVGRGGRPFRVWKFRSMVADAETRLAEIAHLNEATPPLFKMAADPRVTRVGRVLRRLSLDELPQLWNVVRGDMSLVGPRPALAREMACWTPEAHGRLRVRPGLTGMWQVRGRSDTSFEDYVRLDLFYVDNWSLWIDLAIMARTVPTLLLRRGAY